jgi:hypothetical protein
MDPADHSSRFQFISYLEIIRRGFILGPGFSCVGTDSQFKEGGE